MADAGRLSPGVLGFAIGFPVASALAALTLARLVMPVAANRSL
jgi:hypothetical protein